ncbi:MAG TPA: hypothetical protein VHC49_02240 [Mycobacteriales bacterium]|nr:hypothetical protein [Mycobacteriales bacterium]
MGANPQASFVSEGFTALDPGAVVAFTIYGALRGPEPATVTAVTLIPVPGTKTPALRRSALLTGLGSGFIHGWPAHNPDFQHRALIGVPFAPSDHVEILVGVQVRDPGYYAVAGLDIDYTVGGRPYHSRMYGALMMSVHVPYTDEWRDYVTTYAEGLAGFR